MSSSHKITASSRLIENYRADLESAVASAPESERSLYKIFAAAFCELEELLKVGEPIEKIAKNIRSQRHAFGWSYVSGDLGDRVSTSSHELFRHIDEQIIRIKGTEWYHTNEN